MNFNELIEYLMIDVDADTIDNAAITFADHTIADLRAQNEFFTAHACAIFASMTPIMQSDLRDELIIRAQSIIDN
jgi:hypothetical protein